MEARVREVASGRYEDRQEEKKSRKVAEEITIDF